MLTRRISLGLTVAALLAACAPQAPTEITRPTPSSIPLEKKGKSLVDLHGCRGCHEDVSLGLGELAGREGPRSAPNLTPDVDTGLGGWSDEDIARAIREGLDDDGAPLCRSMPRYGRVSDQDIASVLAYLKSLPPVAHETDGSCM